MRPRPRFLSAPWRAVLTALAVCVLAVLPAQAAKTVALSELDLSKAKQGWGKPVADKSVDGNPLTIAGKKYDKGFGTHAESRLIVILAGGCEKFSAAVGVDDEVKGKDGGTVGFRLVGDGKQLWRSKNLSAGDPAEKVEVPLVGVQALTLIVTPGRDGNDSDHANWVDAVFTVTGAAPKAFEVPEEKAEIRTPPAPPQPRINGPTVYGSRPNAPFLYTIPATGDRPMTFAAKGLPEGLQLDPATGRISGIPKTAGESAVTFTATNALGKAEKKFRLVIGKQLALTPPLGWNSWNCFAGAIDDGKVRAAADAMVKSGLINHGWTYINIDDCWSIRPGSEDPLTKGELRDAQGMINTNAKFPDMKALCDYVHNQGLKIGIYSSPGPRTCAQFNASYQHEEQDARRFAEWGFDYLKYDWCSYSEVVKGQTLDRAAYMKPYQVMQAALAKVDRNIIYSLCQYGWDNVWEWGAEVDGNCWRTTGDITDTWESLAGIGFRQDGHEKYAGPGRWNDPDMLIVGMVGWGPNLHPTRLTPNEQYTHITLWSLVSSPLLIGCDMTQLDPFTLNLLTNDEVIAVNQDPLGKPAGRVSTDGETEVWARPLEDGSKAVGLFNRGEMEATATAKWADLGLQGPQKVRDLWYQKDLEDAKDAYTVKIPRHGAVMIKLTPAR